MRYSKPSIFVSTLRMQRPIYKGNWLPPKSPPSGLKVIPLIIASTALIVPFFSRRSPCLLAMVPHGDVSCQKIHYRASILDRRRNSQEERPYKNVDHRLLAKPPVTQWIFHRHWSGYELRSRGTCCFRSNCDQQRKCFSHARLCGYLSHVPDALTDYNVGSNVQIV